MRESTSSSSRSGPTRDPAEPVQAELSFEVLDCRAEKYAAAPALAFRLRIEESSGLRVHSLALRTQVRIEPQRRSYSYQQQKQLFGLFSDSSRWADTLKPFLWTNVSSIVPGFEGSTEYELYVPCSYDMEVAAGSYFHTLREGEVPLLFLFSGQVFRQSSSGITILPISWECEASSSLPAGLWQQLMDSYFPNSGWLRLRRETLDALQRYKALRACATWEDTVASLLEETSAKDVPA